MSEHQKSQGFTPTQISEFYKKYPYPKVDSIEYDFNLLDHFQYLSGRCSNYQLSRKAPQRQGRMLIAGCGTREAVMWAFSLPHYQIDAIDISERSLEISKTLAAQLQLKNVRFIHANFELGEGLEGPYDFIHSFGVLHHLKSPERGLAHLESVLAPGGLMSIMVYNDANRLHYQRAQRVISLLTREVPPIDQEQAAFSVVDRGSQVRNRLQGVFRTAVEEYQDNPAQFADTMLNPQEVSYTIPSLIEYLGSSGLEICSPALPINWQVQDLLTKSQQQIFNQLSLVEQMEICDHLKAPLFWVLVRRSSEVLKPRPCLQDSHLFWNLVPMPLETGVFPVVQLMIQPPRPLTLTFEDAGDPLISIRRGQTNQVFTYHRIAKTLITLFDGKRTLKEIAQLACAQEGVGFDEVKGSLETMLREFIDVLALATPDLSQCSQCPLN